MASSVADTMSRVRVPSGMQQALPSASGDFYDLAALLSEEDRRLLVRVRTFMEEKVAPIINRYWMRAEFPFEIISDYAALEIPASPTTAMAAREGAPCSMASS